MRRGVLLFNLGGPETLEDVRPFLYNLFSDPEIIRIRSGILRRALARLIASLRQGKSRRLYEQIGGGSPLRRITQAQASALSGVLESRGYSARVYVGMRCWKPGIDEAVQHILEDQVTRLVLLPLFPQFSLTTTGSCLKFFRKLDNKLGLSSKIEIATVESWYDEPRYVEAMADLIRESLRRFAPDNDEEVFLLYSAHSLPESYVREGDPYLDQTRRSMELINAALGGGHPSSLAFQSRVGPVRWLRPSTKEALLKLAREGRTRVLVVPLSFVSDHIETLQEIDIACRKMALRAGIREFQRAPALNTYPKFIQALADRVLAAGAF